MAACCDACAMAEGKVVKDIYYVGCGAAATAGADRQWWCVPWPWEPGRQTTHIAVLGVSFVQLYEFMFLCICFNP